MKHPEVSRRKQSLDALFGKVSLMSADIEMQAHWAKYLCVLTSGFIEQSVRLILADYARKQAGPNVGNFVSARLAQFQNAKMGRILAIAGQFDPAWEAELKDATADALKAAIDSIVANRHLIAHGGTTSISFHQIQEYYRHAVKVIQLLEDRCIS